MSLRIVRLAEFLMLTGKNVVLAGAPGVGKTRAARMAAEKLGGARIVVGFEGLTFRGLLVENVVAGDGSVRCVPSVLTRVVVESWARLLRGDLPKHLVFDEVNRCNVDLVLGNVFTALDIEHRTFTPVISVDVAHLVLDLLERSPSEVVEGLGGEEAKRLAELVRLFVGRVGGVPMPCSMRLLATMNVYDRSQLYRLGFALQRRFATLYVPPPGVELKPGLNLGAVEKLRREFRFGDDVWRRFLRQAVRELTWPDCGVRGEGFEVSDPPTILGDLQKASWSDIENRLQSSDEWKSLVRVVEALFAFSEELGIELGYWLPVDAAKLLTVWRAVEEVYGFSIASLNEVADIVVASAVPQLWAAVPRARLELAMYPGSRVAEALARFVDFVEELLGESSMGFLMARSLELELPVRLGRGVKA